MHRGAALILALFTWISSALGQQVGETTLSQPQGPDRVAVGSFGNYSAQGSVELFGPPGTVFTVKLYIGKSSDSTSSATAKVDEKTSTTDGTGKASVSVSGNTDVAPAGTGATRIITIMLIVQQNTVIRQPTSERIITGFDESETVQVPE